MNNLAVKRDSEADAAPRAATQLTTRKKVIFAAVSLAGAMLLGEVGARIVVTKLRGPLFYRVDSTLGYVPRSNMEVVRRNHGFAWRCSTDQRGRRVVPANPSANGAKKVILLGDSFIFGEAVDDDQTFAQVLAERGYHVVNLAVTGHGPHQHLLALRRYLAAEGEGAEPDWILTFVYTNDAEDVLASYQSMHHRPTASSTNGRLDLHPFEPPLTDYIADYCYLFALLRSAFFNQPVRETGDGPEIVATCLSEIDGATRRAGAKPLFFFHDTLAPAAIRDLTAAADSAGVAHVDLSATLHSRMEEGDDIICEDGLHWTRTGSETVASIVEQWMRRHDNQTVARDTRRPDLAGRE